MAAVWVAVCVFAVTVGCDDREGRSPAPPSTLPNPDAPVVSSVAEGSDDELDCPLGQLAEERTGECRPWVLSRRLQGHLDGHTLTRLADGRLLIVGGAHHRPPIALWANTFVFEPRTRRFDELASLAAPRAAHVTVPLGDTGALAIGGLGPSGPLATTERFDPAVGWAEGASMGEPRASFGAALLADGALLVSGGESVDGAVTAGTERYDPDTDAWRPLAPMNHPRRRHTLTRLADGRVLAVGGLSAHVDDPHAHAPPALASAELYDPTADVWREVGPLAEARAGHAAARLAEGGVVVVGGLWDPSLPEERFDPTVATWSPLARLPTGRGDVSVLVSDETLWVVGGFTPGRGLLGEVDRLEGEAFVRVGSLRTERARAGVAALGDGRFLLLGGRWQGPDGASSVLEPRDGRLLDHGPAALAQAPWTSEPRLREEPDSLPAPELTRFDETALAVLSGAAPDDRVWRYDFVSRRWSRLPSLPTPVARAAIGEVPGRGLLVAGGVGPTAVNGTAEAWFLGSDASEWQPWPGLGEPRWGGRLAVDGAGGVLLVGGVASPAAASLRAAPGELGWRLTENGPGGREPAVAVAQDGTVAVCGGADIAGARAGCASWDALTSQWTALPSMTTPRTELTLTVLSNGALLAVGGVDGAGGPTHSVELLEPDASVWRFVASLADARAGHSATRLADGRVLVAGGRAKTGPVVTWVVWSREAGWGPAEVLSGPRVGHAAVATGGARVLLMGGEGAVGLVEELEVPPL